MNHAAYFIQVLRTEPSDRKVARVMGCRRSLEKSLRGLSAQEIEQKLKAKNIRTNAQPEWSEPVNWSEVQRLIEKGHELKRIWEDSAHEQTTYSNFWKYIQKNYSHLLKSTITLREFAPGSQCEVDWAGDKIPWFNSRGERQEAHVFVGVLCFSQLLFAVATRDERQSNFIDAHEQIFRFLAGTPAVTVSDNLKTGVKIPDRYDAELNPVYQDFASHYHTAVVPARVWQYSAVHIALSVPELQSPLALSKELKIPSVRIEVILEFLVRTAMAVKLGIQYTIGKVWIHLPPESPLIGKHHANWRVRAIQSSESVSRDNFHYTQVVSISREDSKRILGIVSQIVERANEIIRPSKEENLRCLAIDFFSLT